MHSSKHPKLVFSVAAYFFLQSLKRKYTTHMFIKRKIMQREITHLFYCSVLIACYPQRHLGRWSMPTSTQIKTRRAKNIFSNSADVSHFILWFKWVWCFVWTDVRIPPPLSALADWVLACGLPRFCLTGTNTLICLCTAVRWQNKRREERREKKWRERGQNAKVRETRGERVGGRDREPEGCWGKRGEERKVENKGKANRALRKRNLSSGNNEGKVSVW